MYWWFASWSPVITKYNKHLFFTVIEAESLRSGASMVWVLGDSLLPGLQMVTFFLYPHMMERKRSGVSSPSLRTLIPSWGLNQSLPIALELPDLE